jgi:hypothetical protein|uniref:Uncharacterized protein n=1 Tax=Myoviridae sp. ctBoB21 TaxID=2827287 RepID=A0A8S5R6W7_9CAUD|nr:MAG TPA: hypothetical protein [Myoviridae sp. ctBoB21]
MEIRVSVLGKVAYKENETREDAEKAELYPFGEGLYAVMDGEIFVALRVVAGKKHSEEKGDYYACVENYWEHFKISNSATIIEHEERLKDSINKRFDRLEAIIEKANEGISSVSEELDSFISNSQDDFCSIENSLERIEKDGVGSEKGISEKTLLSAIEIVSKQK